MEYRLRLSQVSLHPTKSAICPYYDQFTMIFPQLFLVVLSLACVCANPHLLVSKTILNEHMVERKDLTIQYTLYNIGSRWAIIGNLLCLRLNIPFVY